MLALQYALAHGDRLLGLILRDAFAWGQRTTLNALKNILLSKRIQPDPDRQVRLWAGAVRDDQEFADAFNEIAAIYTPESPEPVASALGQDGVPESGDDVTTDSLHHETHNFAFTYNMPNVDLRLRLGEIQAPTLVVVGRHDLLTPPEWAEEIRNAIPNARLAIFENSGHSPPTDEPEAFGEAVNDFLSHLVGGI